MSYCANCGTELNNEANYCPNCGASVSLNQKHRMQQVSQFANTEPERLPVSDSVRKGMTNAVFNKEMSGVLGTEITIVAVAIGIYTESWWWFGGVFLGLIVLAVLPTLGTILCYVFGIAWGVLAYWLVNYIFEDTSAAWVIGIIIGIAGIGANLAGKQYYNDIGN